MRIATLAIVLFTAACSEHKQEQVGTPCTAPAQCYPTVDAGAIRGEVICLTKYPGGYCTHRCQTDADCCAVAGECKTGFKQVCASFENQPDLYCLLSCDPADIAAAPNEGVTGTDAFCKKFAGDALTCRSSGGGAGNRKFCG